jgi:serine protease Do
MVMCRELLTVACLVAVVLTREAVAAGEPADLQASGCQYQSGSAQPISPACQGVVAQNANPSPDQDERKRYIQGVLSKSKVQGKRLALSGSGFFVAQDGTLVTNHLLVSDCAAVSISPVVGEMMLADTIAHDATIDLALLRAPSAPPAVARLAESQGALKREPAYVIGYPGPGPMTTMPGLTPVETMGSQKTALGISTIILKGGLTSGNNGGPLLDSGGGVVGVMVASKSQTYTATDGQAPSIGLALPSEGLRQFLDLHDIDYQLGLELPPKPAERLFIDARRFMAQVGCWQ